MKVLRATMRGAIQEAFANRAGFWTQVSAMIVNDAAWVVFWVLFFHRVGTIRGWDTRKVLLLQASLTASGGFVLGVLANARSIGRLVAGGELDAALALPVRPLAYLLVRRVNTTNLGDLAFGVALFVFGCHPTLQRTLVFLVAFVASSTLLAGFLIAVGSLSFFAGRDDAGELGFHAMLLFSAYPVDIFGGLAKLFLYTLVPAAFVASVPAHLVDSFDARLAIAFLAVAVGFATVGTGLFTLGLRRYTSGAVWTRA